MFDTQRETIQLSIDEFEDLDRYLLNDRALIEMKDTSLISALLEYREARRRMLDLLTSHDIDAEFISW